MCTARCNCRFPPPRMPPLPCMPPPPRPCMPPGHACPPATHAPHPCGQNKWHTLLKILPCRNFVAGGNNTMLTIVVKSVDHFLDHHVVRFKPKALHDGQQFRHRDRSVSVLVEQRECDFQVCKNIKQTCRVMPHIHYDTLFPTTVRFTLL